MMWIIHPVSIFTLYMFLFNELAGKTRGTNFIFIFQIYFLIMLNRMII